MEEAVTEKERFDPRFNPAFQRGFDASAERARRANQTPSLSAEDVVYGRSPRLEVPAPPPPPASEHAQDASDSAPEDEEAAARGRNPYLLALWALGVIFVVGPLALILGPGSTGFNYNGSTGPDAGTIALMQLVAVLCPAMITVGLATMSGLLFWHAAHWKRRQR
jgi:hypothetical protein